MYLINQEPACFHDLGRQKLAVREEIYNESVRQFVEKQAAEQGSSWVKCLLTGEQERERVILRDCEFILVCQSNKR